MPSAIPLEAELVAWAAPLRDEQVRRYREALADPDCGTPTDDTMSDILAAAQQPVVTRNG